MSNGIYHKPIPMLDLSAQYMQLQAEIDAAIMPVLRNAAYINGPEVGRFASELSAYLGGSRVVTCGNGTDALQIALMALQLPPGSEVITCGFAYGAAAEVCALLGLKPVFADADQDTFNLDVQGIEKHITAHTKAIIPVHLYGQCCDMEAIMAIAEKHNLYVIEDNAQSIGAEYTFSDGRTCKAGTIGHIGTTSFFPSKNLSCFGDGGAVYTSDDTLAEKMAMIANHGQKFKYKHDLIGINSRLDTIQAAVLSVKLKHLDAFNAERRAVADAYDAAFAGIPCIQVPFRSPNSTHVFHQYTLRIFDTGTDQFMKAIKAKGVASMVYYPLPLYKQAAFGYATYLPVTEALCQSVVSLPIGPGMAVEDIEYIISTIKENINIQ